MDRGGDSAAERRRQPRQLRHRRPDQPDRDAHGSEPERRLACHGASGEPGSLPRRVLERGRRERYVKRGRQRERRLLRRRDLPAGRVQPRLRRLRRQHGNGCETDRRRPRPTAARAARRAVPRERDACVRVRRLRRGGVQRRLRRLRRDRGERLRDQHQGRPGELRRVRQRAAGVANGDARPASAAPARWRAATPASPTATGTRRTAARPNLSRRSTNCGACGNACAAANATPACVARRVQRRRVQRGLRRLRRQLAANGCETDARNHAPNCGACGDTCVRRHRERARPRARAARAPSAPAPPASPTATATAANGCETQPRQRRHELRRLRHTPARRPRTRTAACTGGACGVAPATPASPTATATRRTAARSTLDHRPRQLRRLRPRVLGSPTARRACAAAPARVGTCNAGLRRLRQQPGERLRDRPSTATTNCGACGAVCAAPANASAACTAAPARSPAPPASATATATRPTAARWRSTHEPRTAAPAGSRAAAAAQQRVRAHGLDRRPLGRRGVTKPTPVSCVVSDGTWTLDYRLGGRDDVRHAVLDPRDRHGSGERSARHVRPDAASERDLHGAADGDHADERDDARASRWPSTGG